MAVGHEQAQRAAVRIAAGEVQLLAYVLAAASAPQPDATPVPADHLPEVVAGQDPEALETVARFVAESLPSLVAAARLLMIRTPLPDTPEWRELDREVRRLVAEHAPRRRQAS